MGSSLISVVEAEPKTEVDTEPPQTQEREQAQEQEQEEEKQSLMAADWMRLDPSSAALLYVTHITVRDSLV
eukprot:COSAG05_NODE_5419_length_1179_cov_1.873148_1_plen_71_part_00